MRLERFPLNRQPLPGCPTIPFFPQSNFPSFHHSSLLLRLAAPGVECDAGGKRRIEGFDTSLHRNGQGF